MFPSTILEGQLIAVQQNTCSGQLANHVTANNTTILNKIDTTAMILFQQIEVTLLIQDVVAIFSSDCFLHHKEDLKLASML